MRTQGGSFPDHLVTLSLQIMTFHIHMRKTRHQEGVAKARPNTRGGKTFSLLVFFSSSSFVLKPLKLLADGQEI